MKLNKIVMALVLAFSTVSGAQAADQVVMVKLPLQALLLMLLVLLLHNLLIKLWI